MALTAPQYQRLTQALLSAFPREAALAQMVRFGLNENLSTIAGGSNLRDIVFALIQWAEAQGKIEDLIIAARKENAGNPSLKQVSQKILAATLEVPEERLEAILLHSVNFIDIESWIEQIWRCSLAVCRIEVPEDTPRGTGFLIRPDIVITNYHVIEDVLQAPFPQDEIAFRFHYRKGSGGITCPLATDKWLVAASRIRERDYALLRIDTGWMQQSDDGDWISLSPQRYSFTVGEAICIIQHPRGNPQKIALGAISAAEASRIYYTTNTREGSSGSPCVNGNGQVVALHQGEGNVGIPFSAILDDLRRQGIRV